MMEAQCAVAETAIRGAEPGLAEVKNYFTCLENRKTNHNGITGYFMMTLLLLAGLKPDLFVNKMFVFTLQLLHLELSSQCIEQTTLNIQLNTS